MRQVKLMIVGNVHDYLRLCRKLAVEPDFGPMILVNRPEATVGRAQNIPFRVISHPLGLDHGAGAIECLVVRGHPQIYTDEQSLEAIGRPAKVLVDNQP